VHWAPGIPHALCWAELNEKLGRNRAAGMLNCISTSLRAQRSNPAFLLSSRRKLDCFVAYTPRNDGLGCLKIESVRWATANLRRTRQMQELQELKWWARLRFAHPTQLRPAAGGDDPFAAVEGRAAIVAVMADDVVSVCRERRGIGRKRTRPVHRSKAA
jgi:hypothetical protein